ncbi:FliH/SctL family protein [[Empedobacter] haloabium]|uniref:Flagellar assembly protein FliH n=1 Tax=[Empedobacter] haloabium TaxID=592317 RepID=A0ABZ1UIQ8_9BURK
MDPIIRSAALTAVPRQLRRPQASSETAAPHVAAVTPLEPVAAVAAALPEVAPEPMPAGPSLEELSAAAQAELAHARQVLADAHAQRDRWLAERAMQEERLAAVEADLARREEAVRRERAALDADCASARDEAAQRGYEEGLAQGVAEGRAGADAAAAQRLAQLDELAAQAATATTRLLDEQEDLLVEVAYAAICRMAGDLAASRAGALATVRAAVAQVREAEGLRVRLHPEDAAWLAARDGGQHGWSLQADERVTLGGCIVEGSRGSLDARLDLQLERLGAALLAARAARKAEPR